MGGGGSPSAGFPCPSGSGSLLVWVFCFYFFPGSQTVPLTSTLGVFIVKYQRPLWIALITVHNLAAAAGVGRGPLLAQAGFRDSPVPSSFRQVVRLLLLLFYTVFVVSDF